MWPKITENYSPNFCITKRSKIKVKFIIIHYTGMKNELSALRRLCTENSKVSAHYFIKKNGSILKLVPDLYIAWHAGISRWKNKKNLNEYSIGIEIQNSGHEYLNEKFLSKQIISLKKLLKFLMKKYKINHKNVLGHSDIAPARKKDPGEKFPWKNLAKNKLALWHTLNERKIKKKRLQHLKPVDYKKFTKNLGKIGYKRSSKKENKIFIVKAFQRRFRSELINGISDQECFLISQNLLKR